MPTYPYHCASCEKDLEIFQKITEPALIQCPQCGSPSLKRGIGGGMASFSFKGNGFYSTDYKNKQGEEPRSSPCPCGKKSPCS